MSDVATLLNRLEALSAGEPLRGDDAPSVIGTRGRLEHTNAACRVMNVAISGRPDHIPARLACELVDNLDTILAALLDLLRADHRQKASWIERGLISRSPNRGERGVVLYEYTPLGLAVRQTLVDDGGKGAGS